MAETSCSIEEIKPGREIESRQGGSFENNLMGYLHNPRNIIQNCVVHTTSESVVQHNTYMYSQIGSILFFVVRHNINR
jgi:hypothetical protein